MKPSNLHDAIEHLIAAKRPCFVWSAPGVGKSDIVSQVAQATGRTLHDVRVALLDPVDLRGVPSVDNGKTRWNTPEFLPSVDEPAILFLDELNQGAMDVQAACFQLVRNRRLGEYVLPDDCAIVAAGNRLSDKAAAKRMASALSTRFIHVDLEVDNDDWTQWAFGNDIAPEVISFLRFRPDSLLDFDPNARESASPRTWQFVSDILKGDPPAELAFELYSGAIGQGHAAEFVGFLQIAASMPSLDGILMNPESGPVPDLESPDGVATMYAVCVGLASKASGDNFNRIVAYADRLPTEFATVIVSDAARRNPEVCNTQGFIKWCANNNSVLV